MRFHEVFVNCSNFERLKIEEIIFVKLQMCEIALQPFLNIKKSYEH